jgi:hypothetical protein
VLPLCNPLSDDNQGLNVIADAAGPVAGKRTCPSVSIGSTAEAGHRSAHRQTVAVFGSGKFAFQRNVSVRWNKSIGLVFAIVEGATNSPR